jgi:hypothetical protein
VTVIVRDRFSSGARLRDRTDNVDTWLIGLEHQGIIRRKPVPEDSHKVFLGEAAELTLPDDEIATTNDRPHLRVFCRNASQLFLGDNRSVSAAEIGVARNRLRSRWRRCGRET